VGEGSVLRSGGTLLKPGSGIMAGTRGHVASKRVVANSGSDGLRPFHTEQEIHRNGVQTKRLDGGGRRRRRIRASPNHGAVGKPRRPSPPPKASRPLQRSLQASWHLIYPAGRTTPRRFSANPEVRQGDLFQLESHPFSLIQASSRVSVASAVLFAVPTAERQALLYRHHV
jgi:hypothetical protein